MIANSEFPRIDTFSRLRSLLSASDASSSAHPNTRDLQSASSANQSTGFTPFPKPIYPPSQLAVERVRHANANRALQQTRKRIARDDANTSESTKSTNSSTHDHETCAICYRGIYSFHYNMHECSQCHKQTHQACHQQYLRHNEKHLKYKQVPPCPNCRYEGTCKRANSKSGQEFMVDVQDNNRKLKRRMPDGTIVFYEGTSGNELPVYKLTTDGKGFFYGDDGKTLIPDKSSHNNNNSTENSN